MRLTLFLDVKQEATLPRLPALVGLNAGQPKEMTSDPRQLLPPAERATRRSILSIQNGDLVAKKS